MKNLSSLLFLLMFSVGTGTSASAAASGTPVTIKPVGEHYPVFQFEKNEKPENIMIAYVKLLPSCEIQPNVNDPATPLFDFYWLMSRERYKPVHKLIKSGIRKRLEVVEGSFDPYQFMIKLTDLGEMSQELGDSVEMKVKSRKTTEGCEVAAEMMSVRVSKLYSRSRKTLMPPFRKVESLTLTGVSLANGKPVQRTYQKGARR